MYPAFRDYIHRDGSIYNHRENLRFNGPFDRCCLRQVSKISDRVEE